MMCPIVSIVIPVYNVEPYITDCLQSVMYQTYTGPLECILVDDCGTDKSIEVAEKLIAEYDGPIEFKVLHHEHNRGLSAARNTGMDLAKGDYVTVGKLPYQLELSLPEGSYHEKGISTTFCNHGVYVMAVNKLYSKEFMNKNRLSFEEGKVHEDEILAFEISCIEKSFYVVKSVSYYYRIRKNSITTNKDLLKKIEGYAGVLQSVKRKVKRYEKMDGVYDFYMFWIKRVFNWVSKVEMDEELLSHIQKLTKGYLEPIHGVRYLKNKHDRLIYYACKREQTYLRYQYVNNEYSEKLLGRIVRNVLNLLPDKQFVA